VQQQQLSVYNARQALLRVESEQLAQRANLHLVLGGNFMVPPEPPADVAQTKTAPPSGGAH